MSAVDTFYIIDLHSQAYRAYYARTINLHSPSGVPTKVPYLLTETLMKLCRDKKPSYLCAADDPPRHQLARRKLYPAYKANRDEGNGKDTRSEFAEQMELVRTLWKLLGVPIILSETFEADDVIATLATECVSDDVHVVVVSSDHDLHQLLTDDRISIFDPLRDEVICKKDLKARFGYSARQLADAKVLAGDSGDNVKGLPGVGLKTALKAIRHCTPEELAGNRMRASVYLPRKAVKAISPELIKLNRQLCGLCRTCPINVPNEQLQHNGLAWHKALPLLRELGFRRWEAMAGRKGAG